MTVQNVTAAERYLEAKTNKTLAKSSKMLAYSTDSLAESNKLL